MKPKHSALHTSPEFESAAKKNKLSHPSSQPTVQVLIHILPDELLALIFKLASNCFLPIVCSRFRDVMYNEIYDCFFNFGIYFPLKHIIPNPLVVRDITIKEDIARNKHLTELVKFKNVTQLALPNLHNHGNEIMDHIVKNFPHITDFTFGNWFDHEAMQHVSLLKSLQRLTVYDVEGEMQYKEEFKLDSLL